MTEDKPEDTNYRLLREVVGDEDEPQDNKLEENESDESAS